MPLIFEPPSALLQAQAAGSFGSPADGSGLGWTPGAQQVWIGASPQNASRNWGGCNVLLSLSGASYAPIGQITQRAKQGVLSVALAAYAGTGVDFAHTLAVDLTMSGGALPNGFGVAAAVFATVASGNVIAFSEEGALANVAVGDYVGDLTTTGAIGAGVTVASVSPGGLTPSVTLSASVSSTVSEGDLILFAPALPPDAQLAPTLCYVGGELVAYAYAAPTGTGTYALQGLYRDLYRTAGSGGGGSGAIGAAFCLLDGAIFKYNLPPALIGLALQFKFQSFNAYGAGLRDLSGQSPAAHTPSNAGASPSWAPGAPGALAAQTLLLTSNFTVTGACSNYVLNAAGGSFTVTMPAAPTLWDTYSFGDYRATLGAHPVTINWNGNDFQGSAANTVLGMNYMNLKARWNGAEWDQCL